jgi:drug/metabolite transporter (DMT)-like permease
MRFVAGDRARLVTLIGTLIGFVGIAILALPGNHGGDVETWGILLMLVATVSWANGSFFASRVPLPTNPFVATAWQMLVGGGLMLVLGSARGEWNGFSLGDAASNGWWALAYLVVVGSIAGYSAYVWLLANAPISLTATYAYVNPVVAVFLGAVILDEAVTAAILAGGAIVVVGVGLVVSAERPRRRAVPTQLSDGADVASGPVGTEAPGRKRSTAKSARGPVTEAEPAR